ncbi:hypothetical protein QCA50_014736 [Cerrena zonata]|uniref:Nitrate reductase n=1 Tax=Cerrena zonata TaxID=2478898 RepID=A0AAW0FV54_9APHY
MSNVQSEPITLPQPFIPPSLQEPLRPSPSVPSSLPQLPVDDTPLKVADADLRTPDNWIKRNPKLIRLTGQHPFNVEPNLDDLFDAGFLTPAHLHFVRNHGAVPQVDEEKLRNWRIRVHGQVKNEVSLSLDDLRTNFKTVTIPVTLVCAGNRRKEQNVVRKSLGFSWGAAGVSTALWTGVYLADVLKYVQPIRPHARHVIFEGTDDLPNGRYGTSQKLSQAMNRDKCMLIAWAMNGLPLEPDHGFPVRVIIPGQIGGRMVKWLNRIEISENESQHYARTIKHNYDLHTNTILILASLLGYIIWYKFVSCFVLTCLSSDNKVLPMELSPDRARSEKDWWYDPNYIITELNVNSAIAKPSHDETLIITHGEDPGCYTLRGYAYTGGGRRVTRVEISLDAGETWTLANIDYPEDRYRSASFQSPVYGTLDLTESDFCYCWCFWDFKVPIVDLLSTHSIAVRAMDESLNVQSRDMYLNATSMMNNWWFRVAIHREDTRRGSILRFEHPTLAGGRSGGWMERLKASGLNPLHPDFQPATSKPEVPQVPTQLPTKITATKPGIDRKITVAEFWAQDKSKPWFIVNGEVYDATKYLQDHPGGADSIILMAGEDATEDFTAIHSSDAWTKLSDLHIGTLVGSLSAPSSTEQAIGASFLQPKQWKNMTITEIRRENHDSWYFVLSASNPEHEIGLPTGQHVFLRVKRRDTGEVVQRAYTPVSREVVRGRIEFLIKLYLPTPEYPNGGKMSVQLGQMHVGDTIEVKGPLGSFTWLGPGRVSFHGQERKVRKVGLVCGGSGITPILQVLRAILENPEDQTRVWLLDANKSELDILCREELDALAKTHGPERFKLHYVVSAAPNGWTHSIGRITDNLIKAHLPAPCAEGLILACGPEPMISQTLKPSLQKCGWDIESSLVVF